MKYSFLKNMEQGQNALWRYLAGILLAIGCGFVGLQWIGTPLANLVVGLVAIFGEVNLTNEFGEKVKPIATDSLEISYISIHLAYLFFSAGLLLAVKLLHQRRMLTLISPDATFKAKRFALGFSLWLVLAAMQTLLNFLYNREAFLWIFRLFDWSVFLPWALVFTPIQTSTEELLFRGYLLQGLGRLIRQPVALTLVASFPFAIAHFGNPEMARSDVWIGLTYFLLAAFLTLITLKDGRLELALGVHAANNLFIVLLVNTHDSVLPTPALMIQQSPTDPRFTLGAMLLSTVVFYGLVFGRK